MDENGHGSPSLEQVHACFALLRAGRHAEAASMFPPAVLDRARELMALNEGINEARLEDAAPAGEFGPGTVVGEFTIVRELGEGGLGSVYEAVERGVGRRVALKVMVGAFRADDRPMAPSEARLLAQLEHPSIARLYRTDVSTIAGRRWFWIAMQLVQGGRPITQWCVEASPTIEARIDAIAQIAVAVQHAHGRGVIHRDLKPANVLVDGAGLPMVIDFGIAGLAGGDPALTQVLLGTRVEGTMGYLAPEALTPGRAPDVRCDVFALGALLYEVLAGKPLREVAGRSIPQQLAAVSMPAAVSLPALVGLQRRELERIVRRATAHDPADRYASAAQVAEDLGRHLRGEPVLMEQQGRFERVRRTLRRNARVAAVGTLVAVALITAAVVAIQQAFVARDQARAAQLALVSRAIGDADRSTIESASTGLLTEAPSLERDVVRRLLSFGRDGFLPASGTDWVLLPGGKAGIGAFHSDDIPDFQHTLLARAEAGQVVWRVPQPRIEIGAVCLTRDGSKVVVANLNGDLAVHDAATGAGVPLMNNHGDVWDQAITVELGNGWIAAAGHELRLWSIDGAPRLVATIPLEVGLVRSMAAHPTEPSLLAVGGEQGSAIVDAATGRVSPIGPPGKLAFAIEWTLDGSAVLIGGQDLLRVSLTGEVQWTTAGHKGTIWGLARLDDGRMVSAGTDGALRCWSVGSGVELGDAPLASEKLWSVDARDGALGVSSQAGAFTIPASAVGLWFGERIGPVLCVARDGTRVERVASDRDRVRVTAPHGVREVTAPNGVPILAAAASTGGQRVVLALDDGDLVCIDTDTNSEVWRRTGVGDAVHEMERHGIRTVLIDDRTGLVFVCSRTLGLRAFGLATGDDRWTWKHHHQLESAALAPGASRVFVTGREGHVIELDAQSGQMLRAEKPCTQSIRASAVSTDGTRVVLGTYDGALVILDAHSLAEVLRVPCSRTSIEQVWCDAEGIHSVDAGGWHRVR